MSKPDIIVCDGPGCETIRENLGGTATKGLPTYVLRVGEHGRRWDFCSSECLKAWVEQIEYVVNVAGEKVVIYPPRSRLIKELPCQKT